MRKFFTILLCACAFIIAATTPSYAVLIIDTGVPTETGGGYSMIPQGQYWAGEFTINSSATINAMQTWLPSFLGGTITLNVYDDGGEFPNFDSLISSNVFNVPGLGADIFDWYGPSGMNLNLNAGTYWAAFEIIGNNTYQGYSPGSAPNPLQNYAGYWEYLDGVWGWNQYDASGFSLRVYTPETSAVIPEPTTMLLFGIGSLGVFFRRKIAK